MFRKKLKKKTTQKNYILHKRCSTFVQRESKSGARESSVSVCEGRTFCSSACTYNCRSRNLQPKKKKKKNILFSSDVLVLVLPSSGLPHETGNKFCYTHMCVILSVKQNKQTRTLEREISFIYIIFFYFCLQTIILWSRVKMERRAKHLILIFLIRHFRRSSLSLAALSPPLPSSFLHFSLFSHRPDQ